MSFAHLQTQIEDEEELLRCARLTLRAMQQNWPDAARIYGSQLGHAAFVVRPELRDAEVDAPISLKRLLVKVWTWLLHHTSSGENVSSQRSHQMATPTTTGERR